jgi:hypothetical protein
MTFAAAERVADAVLYEGYVLYPYRASTAKNRFRWQFGVVVPPGYAAGEASEAAAVRADCLLRAGPDAALDVRVRFLRLEARRVELPCPGDPARFDVVAAHRLDGRDLVTWDVGLPHTVDLSDVRVADLLKGDRTTRIDLPAQRTEEVIRDGEAIVRARVVRERWPLTMRVRISAAPAGAWIRVTVRVENTSDWPVGRLPDRDEALRQSCASTHVLVAAGGGTFGSLTDPEPDAAAAASECVNQGLWPVLVGPEGRRDLVLASPIILPDYPEVASESPGDLCDATEIDEILTLRILTMTDDEKREACATDARAREIIERTDALPPEVFERLHGAIRQLGTESFFNPPDDAPLGGAVVRAGGARIGRGSHVRLHPSRRADTMDMFLEGRAATVAGVYRDVEDRAYVAVTIDDDPAADIQKRAGRFFYFYPDEIEPIEAAPEARQGRQAVARSASARGGARLRWSRR